MVLITHLDHLHRHIFEYRTRLLGHRVFVKGEMVENPGGVACIGPGHNGQRVAPDRSNGADVGRQPARATRVAGVEHQDAGRSGVVFVKILGRQVGGRWGSGRGVCHHMAWSWCANYGGCARPSVVPGFLCPVLLLQRWCVVTA